MRISVQSLPCPLYKGIICIVVVKDLILTIIFHKDISKCHHILGLRRQRLSGGHPAPHHLWMPPPYIQPSAQITQLSQDSSIVLPGPT